MSRTKTKTVGTCWSRCTSCGLERTMAVRETRPRGMRSLLHRGEQAQRSVVCLVCAVREGAATQLPAPQVPAPRSAQPLRT